MADPQFYIMIGILTAISAIVSTEIRNSKSLRPTKLGRWAWLLVLAVWVNVGQILSIMMSRNEIESMTASGMVHFALHSVTVIILGLLAAIWYVSVAWHRETDAGLPPSPASSKGK